MPGGFGDRGIEGKILAAKYARENSVPYLGICLGMQVAVIEFARNCANLKNANSTEFDAKTASPVVAMISEWTCEQSGELKQIDEHTIKGGTMRLGAQKTSIKNGTLLEKIYQSDELIERHRHRYEVNPKWVKLLEDHGLIIAGLGSEGFS